MLKFSRTAHGDASGELGTGGRAWRIVIYSHDTMGIGHTRRNLLLAQALAGAPLHAGVLCIAGMRQAHQFALPDGVDCLTLPALHKEGSDRYRSRHLPIPVHELIALRAETIRAAIQSFAPDLLIVDKVPRGAIGELEPVLRQLRQQGATRCVLGLRDVLDEPEAVAREWWRDGSEEAVREFYDAVWIYGDASIFNAVQVYGFSDAVASKVAFTGYLDPRPRMAVAEGRMEDPYEAFGLPKGRMVLCMAGGGEDGLMLVEAFARARFPADMHGVVIAGPMMPADARVRLEWLAAQRQDLRVLSSVPEPGFLLRRAERVIAMGGYNSVCEVLAYGKHALIVPRVTPRHEQRIRAERFSALGLLEMLHPDALTPDALAEWLARDLPSTVEAPTRIDFGGLHRLPELAMTQLLASRGESRRSGREIQHVS